MESKAVNILVVCDFSNLHAGRNTGVNLQSQASFVCAPVLQSWSLPNLYQVFVAWY